MRDDLPMGLQSAGAWGEQGQIVSVAAGAGVTPTPFAVLVSRVIGAREQIWLEKVFLRVVDMAAYDQIFFSLRRNGMLIYPWHKISAEQVVEEFSVDVEESFKSGMLEIVATNISGVAVTVEPTAAPDPVAIRCIARFKGKLLRERLSLPRSMSA